MKQLEDFIVIRNVHPAPGFALLELMPENGEEMPPVKAGQFVQAATRTPGVMLRRPISVCRVDKEKNLLYLLVRNAGKGTEWLVNAPEEVRINLLYPLGNGFSSPSEKAEKILLVGGGVGVAPLLQLGMDLRRAGYSPECLLGFRSSADKLLIDEFTKLVGPVHISTDDGSEGHHGFVTQNPVLASQWDMVYCCGPAPMMKGVAAICRSRGITCEVSLENMMACGLGACLCCVEKTVKGNVCVCTEGPVFNINQLTWQA